MALSIMNSIQGALKNAANLGNKISHLPSIKQQQEIKAADSTISGNATQLQQLESYIKGKKLSSEEREGFLRKIGDIRDQNRKAWNTKQNYNPSEENLAGYMSGGISEYLVRRERALKRMQDQQEFRKTQSEQTAGRKKDLSDISVGGVKFNNLPANMQKIIQEEDKRRPFNGE